MPTIIPIRDLRNTSELYDQFAANNRIDQAITEAEAEFELTGDAIDAKTAFDELEKKYFG